MVSGTHIQTHIVALLSAANVANNDKNCVGGLALSLPGGDPLLAHQIAALRLLGIERFVIEVDTVSGALLSLADSLKRAGCSVDFVRSAADLQPFLRLDDVLLVQSETLYLSPALLRALLEESHPFVATVDGRDENAAFERMDLNTRWAGLALVGAPTVAAVSKIPSDWSITSSLLRQSIQDRVKLVPLPQRLVQDGELRVITTVHEAGLLSKHILLTRAQRQSGFIENKIFAPISISLAPFIWRISYGSNLVDGVMLGLSLGGLALAIFGWTIAAVCLGIVAIFLNSLRNVARDPEQNSGWVKWVEPFFWLLLAAVPIAAARSDLAYTNDGPFAALVMTALALLAHQLTLPNWARNTLRSPAMLAATILLTAPIFGLLQVVQWIVIIQLGAFLLAKWAGNGPKKNANHA